MSDQHHHHEGGGDRARDEDATRWDERYAGTDRLWSAEPNATVAEVVGSMSPARALDVGTGEGRHAVWLARRGWSVIAVDFSAVGIDRGRAESTGLAIDWVVADVREWHPPDGARYDLVLSVYLHLPADVFTGPARGSPPAARWSCWDTRCATSPMASVVRRIPGCSTPRSSCTRRPPD